MVQRTLRRLPALFIAATRVPVAAQTTVDYEPGSNAVGQRSLSEGCSVCEPRMAPTPRRTCELTGLLFATSMALGFAQPASAQRINKVVFTDEVTQTVQLKGDTATVYDRDGKALLVGSRAYIGLLAGSTGKVAEWDVRGDKVKLQGVGQETWLACRELRPMAVACTLLPTTNNAGDLVLAPVERSELTRNFGGMGRLPVCPGDPRCPRPKPRR